MVVATLACTHSGHQAPSTVSPSGTQDGGRGQPPEVVTGAVGHKVDDFLTGMSGFGYSGNALIVVHDTVVLRKGYGLAQDDPRIPYTPETIFEIGSLAKQFTAAAVLKLETRGKLSLTDSLPQYLSNVPADKRGITIKQLLTHVSGIVSGFPFKGSTPFYEDVGRDEAVRRILAARLDFQPGHGARYSNSGYILLAAIVERASGQPFRQYVRDSIFEAAGLQHTGFWGDPHVRTKAALALGYDEYGNVVHDPTERSDSTWYDLGGGMVLSTLADLARWRSQLANGGVLPLEAVQRMWTPYTKELIHRDGDYGYGWFLQRTPRGGLVIQHGGDYLGTGVEFKWFRDDSVLMITSTNVRHDFFPTRARTDYVIPKIIFGGDHPEPPHWASDTALLRAVAGEYRLATGGALIIHASHGRYFVGARGQDATDLLVGSTDSTQQRRAALSALAQQAMDSALAGDLHVLARAQGPGDTTFPRTVVKEIIDLDKSPVRSATVLGTFPSGYPRGNPLDYETTLIGIHFDTRDTTYAIRWANKGIQSTETPAFQYAADMEVEPDGTGGLVAWHIIWSHGITMTLTRDASGIVDGLVISSPQRATTTARRSR